MRRIVKALRARLKPYLGPYYFMRTSRPVVASLDKRARFFYNSKIKNLSGTQVRVAKGLQENGIAISSLEEIFPNKNILSKLKNYYENTRELVKTGRKKTFLEYLWQERVLLDLENPFIKLSLEPRVLDIANSYLKCAPKFKFSSLAVTRLMAQGEETKGSQRWHRDPGLGRLCKVFVYLTDVDEEGAGPFIYIKGSHLSGKWGKIFPQELYGREGIYPPEGEVEKIVPKEDIKVCLGKAGTIIFCDTIGLHKGGYSTKKERIMYTALYERPSAFGKAKFKYPSDFKNQIKNLDLPVQYALKP